MELFQTFLLPLNRSRWLRFCCLWIVLAVALPGPTGAAEERSVIAPLASRSLLLDGVSVDGLSVVVGERGHILLSRDHGQTWQQIAVPSRATLTGVYFHDQSLGWAVGYDQVILRTQDGGASWRKVYANPEGESPLFDIWFRDAQHGFALGAYGLLLATVDGGESWSELPFNPTPPDGGEEESSVAGEDEEYGEITDFHLNHIAGAGTGRLYIAAEAGHIYRSDDHGKSWIDLPSDYRGSYFGILPLGGERLLLFGLRGHLFRSADAGETWQPVATDTQAMLTSGLRLKDGTVVIAGLRGTLLVSHDDGRSFTLRQQQDRKGISAVVQAGNGDLILIGEEGVKRLDSAITRGGNHGLGEEG